VELSLFDVRNSIELVLSLALFAVKGFAFFDANIRPKAAYVAADKQTKLFWVLVLGLFLVAHMLSWRPIGILNLIGTVAAFVYLADARPALRELGRGGGYNRGPYG
jgi:hypothetical protein